MERRVHDEHPVELEHGGPAMRTYRSHRRAAVLVSALVGVPAAFFGVTALRMLLSGGDARLGIVPYFGFVATMVVGWFVLRPLWQRSVRSREVLHPVPDVELAPGDHLTLARQITPPQRW
jgi:hypothetical protein